MAEADDLRVELARAATERDEARAALANALRANAALVVQARERQAERQAELARLASLVDAARNVVFHARRFATVAEVPDAVMRELEAALPAKGASDANG